MPKRKAEQKTRASRANKKQKVTYEKEIRLPLELIGKIFSFLDEEEAALVSRVSVDWRGAYTTHLRERSTQQFLSRIKYIHFSPEYISQEQCDQEIADVEKAIKISEKELRAMKYYAERLTDLKIQHGNLSITEKFWIWSEAPVDRVEDTETISIQPEGEKDIWDLIKPDRRGQYFLENLVEFLMDHFEVEVDNRGRASGDPAQIAVFEKYLQELMNENFGSCVYNYRSKY